MTEAQTFEQSTHAMGDAGLQVDTRLELGATSGAPAHSRNKACPKLVIERLAGTD